MLRFIMPAILIGISIAAFFTFTHPIYNQIYNGTTDTPGLKAQIASYTEALDNSKALESERDKLTQKYNAFKPDDINKLQIMVPDNVDNIRLILEIEKIASPYGMGLKDVKYDTVSKNSTTGGTTTGTAGVSGMAAAGGKAYGTWNLEFSTEGTYNNFLNFLKDLEKNLRIVDVASIDFSSSSNAATGVNPSSTETYKYNFKIQTYWLKN